MADTSATGAPRDLDDAAARGVLSVRDLAVDLGGARILHDVSLDVRSGEVVAVLGANGSGKSTLMRALVRAVPVAAGQAEILGHPLGGRVPWDRIGYVPQRVSLAGGVPATAREIVASGLLGPRRLRRPRDWRDRVDQALADVGLPGVGDHAVSELSGGQQQRVLIARALVRRPDLVLLDEPLAGVDLPSQVAFADTLRTLVASGVTLVVVLHELGPLADLITRTVVLRHGRVVHDGPPLAPAHGHDDPEHEHLHAHEDAVERGPVALGPEPFSREI